MKKLKMLWRYFTGTSVKAEMLRFAYIGIQGMAVQGAVMWLLLNLLKLRISFWVVEDWMVPFALGAIAGYFHNFFLNKLLGGLTRISRSSSNLDGKK